MTKAHLLLAATLGVAIALPAHATAAAPAPKAAAPAASNAPKATSRADFVAALQKRFNATDTNHDGMLDAAEMTAMQQRELEQAHAIEQKKLEAEFTKLDTNKDGQLSKAEFMAAAPALKARVTPQQMIAQVDSNKDGKISLQEYEASPLGNFNKLDANHDGIVTAQEMQAARNAKKK